MYMCVGGNDSVSLSNFIDLSLESERSCICVLEVIILSLFLLFIDLSQESERSCICVLEVMILSLFLLFY